MFCETCSQQMNPDARFCCHCGKPMHPRSWYNFGGRLVRPVQGRMIAGVCAGIAQAYGFDPALVRVITVLLGILGHGFVVIAYVAAWIIMPNGAVYYAVPGYPGNPPGGAPPAAPGNGPGSAAGAAPGSFAGGAPTT